MADLEIDWRGRVFTFELCEGSSGLEGVADLAAIPAGSFIVD
jgi:hypothetical protein